MKNVKENLNGFTENEIIFFAKAYNEQIRDCNPDVVAGQILLELKIIAENYGANEELGKDNLEECLSLIFQQFSYLSVRDLKKAYQDWMAGKLNLGKEALMWHGKFNAGQLGKVLLAYRNRRKIILARILNENNKIQEEARKTAKKQKLKADFEASFPKNIEKARGENVEWEDIPPWWWTIIKKRKWLKFQPGEAQKLFEEAADLATVVIAQIEENNRFQKMNKKFHLLRQFDPTAIQKQIAGQLAIKRKIIDNPDFIIPKL